MEKMKLYVISSHVDKALKEDIPGSKYEITIQAGAALTDKRIAPVNDHDDFAESISDRNMRYCEATAMYWIYKHLDETEYIGISHYRRRLKLDDAELERCMDEHADLITSKSMKLNKSIRNHYCELHYGWDWKLFMDILQKSDPEYFPFYEEKLNSCYIHAGNVNIYHRELYTEFCEWAFPILEEFYRSSYEKTDIYQRRDVGFISERMAHLFIKKMERQGKKILEFPLVEYKSDVWNPANACDYGNVEDILSNCNRLYRMKKIKECSHVVALSMKKGCVTDQRMKNVSEVIAAALIEKTKLPETLHEYLPENLRSDLFSLIQTWSEFKKIVKKLLEAGNEESTEKFKRYILSTNFSEIAVDVAIKAVLNPDDRIEFTI